MSEPDPKHPNRGDFYERTKYGKEEKAFAGRFGEAKMRTKITLRERFIAATVIQWLGTNCGMAFLKEALDKCGLKIVQKSDAKI